MASDQREASTGLQLIWPSFIQYHSHIDDPGFVASAGDAGIAIAKQNESGNKKYNSISAHNLGDSQHLLPGEIRLLDLYDGERRTPLMGKLRKARLNGHEVYEALSYTWDDHPTDVTGHDDDDFYPFLQLEREDESLVGMDLREQTNCVKALYRLRKDRGTCTDGKKQYRTIWVDAICINQKDDFERSQQVGLMHEIYRRPLTVVAYVGHKSDEHHSSTAMFLLRYPEKLRTGKLDDFESLSMKHMMERPYFQRMWIVQECVSATSLNLVCGPDEVVISQHTQTPIEVLMNGLQTAAFPAWLRHSQHRTISEQPGATQAQKLLELLLDTVSCECKDARDRIFAVFGLLRNRFGNNPESERQQQLVADYTLSTEQVYSGTAAFLATNGFLGTVLTLAVGAAGDRKSLPSWVVDWSAMRHETREILQTYGTQDEANIRDAYIRTKLGEGLSAPGTLFDSGYVLPQFYKNGVVKLRGFVIGQVLSDGQIATVGQENFLLNPTIDGPWAIIVPAQDFSSILFVKRAYRGSGNVVLTKVLERAVVRNFGNTWKQEGGLEFSCSSFLSTSERSRYAQLTPDYLKRLTEWPLLWSERLDSQIPTRRLSTHGVMIICRELEEKLCTLQQLWQKWQEQAPLGRCILADEKQVQLVLDEIKRKGPFDQSWNPPWPPTRKYEYSDFFHYGKHYGDFAFAGFVSLFVQDPDGQPDELDVDSTHSPPKDPPLPIKAALQKRSRRMKTALERYLRRKKTLKNNVPEKDDSDHAMKDPPPPVSGKRLSVEATSRHISPLQHLVDWAETTFKIFAQLEGRIPEKDGDVWETILNVGGLEIPSSGFWTRARNAMRDQAQEAEFQSGGTSLLQTNPSSLIILHLQQIRLQIKQDHPTRPRVPISYWEWSAFTEAMSTAMSFWTDAKSDIEKVKAVRQSMNNDEWNAFVQRLDTVDAFAKQGLDLVNPKFISFNVI